MPAAGRGGGIAVVTAGIEGPFLAVCELLAAAGATKMVRPDTTSRALSAAGLWAPRWLVRTGAFVELAIGTGAAVTGSPLLAAAVTASFLGFTAFVAVALVRHWPLASCGCFAAADSPPTRSHVVMNLLASVVAGTVVVTGAPSLPDVLRGPPTLGIALIVLSGAVGGLMFLSLTTAARLGAVRRTGAGLA